MNFELDQVKDAHERWVQANSRSNGRKQLERARIQKEQEEVNVDKEVDVSDIDKLFTEKGKGPHLLELEFEPVTEQPVDYLSSVTGEMTRHWKWKHKLTGGEVKRYTTNSGKGFDTGTMSRFLKKNKELLRHRVASERAKHILMLNKKSNRVEPVAGVPLAVQKETLVRQWVSFCLFCFLRFLYNMI
jgi:hypothetical protein